MPSAFDFVAQFRRLQADLDALPPRPRAIYTNHSVPFGRVYRQWTSHGDLIIWVNRGEFEDMPRMKTEQIAKAFDVPSHLLFSPAIYGIPVVNT